tara:strand:- start:66 stop:488 length:423 start_codon:yes stop_codon:yes gene_type:complete
MAQKMAAYGAIVKYGSTAVGEVRSVTPPNNVRERVESDDLSSTIKTSLPGIYAEDEIEFVQLYEPGDADHEAINTLQANQTTSAWSLVYPPKPDGDGTTTATQTKTFNAIVMDISEAEMDNSSIISRTVTLARQGAITTS